jgi:hypothetical protein
MSDHYEDVCSICGESVNADTLYYCCPACHRRHRKQKDRDGNDTTEVAFIQGSRASKEEATHTDLEVKEPQGVDSERQGL